MCFQSIHKGVIISKFGAGKNLLLIHEVGEMNDNRKIVDKANSPIAFI